MDNKYALGSTRVAVEHHELHHKVQSAPLVCKFCGNDRLVLSPTMHDHRCSNCGEWQDDISKGYSTGRSSDY